MVLVVLVTVVTVGVRLKLGLVKSTPIVTQIKSGGCGAPPIKQSLIPEVVVVGSVVYEYLLSRLNCSGDLQNGDGSMLSVSGVCPCSTVVHLKPSPM